MNGPDERELAAVPARILAVTRDFALVYDPLAERRMTVEPFSLEVLRNLRGFAAMEAHAERCLERMRAPREQLAAVARSIAELERIGLLVTKNELLRRVRSELGEVPACRIAAAAWSTRARPGILVRGMSGFIENFRKYGRRPRLLVNDDSRNPSEQSAAKQAVEALAAATGERIEYFGLEEKHRLLLELERSGLLPGESVSSLAFGLFGDDDPQAPPYGGNYNFSLLMSAGHPFLSIDDDMVCRPARIGQENGELALDSDESWRVIRHYNSRSALLEATPETDCDLLGEMERLLGRPVQGLLGAWPSDKLLIGATGGRLWPALAGTRPGSIPLVVGGLYGDAGSSAPSWLLAGDPVRRAEWLSSELAFQLASTSRILLDLNPGLSLTEKHSFKSGYFAFDARKLPAPFFPIDRNTDSLFGLATMLIQPGSLFGRVPTALFHDPPDRPVMFDDPRPADPLSSCGEMLRLLSEEYRPGGDLQDEQRRLSDYAAYLAEAAELPEESFVEMYRLKCFSSLARLLQVWERLAAIRPLPQAGARYFKVQCQITKNILQGLDAGLRQAQKNGRLERNRGRIRSYVVLLEAWPEIWRHCQKKCPPV